MTLDYEKKYKEALKIIKGSLDALNEISETGAEVVNIKSIENCFYKAFPELKDSEGDKLREQVVYAINQLHVCECTKDKLLSWLDTQVSPDTVADAYLRGCNDTEKKWFEKQGEESYTYNPYKVTIESILDMCKRYSESGDLLDFFNNVEVKCKDAIKYDKTWLNEQG